MQAQQSRREFPKTLDARKVKQAARGQWLDIISCLAGSLATAAKKPGAHFPCPVHGGKDGFRFFKDANDTGGGICNTCGSFDDGFKMLQWINDYTFPEAVADVGQQLRMDPENEAHVNRPQRPVMAAPVESAEEKRKRVFKDKKLRDELARVWCEGIGLDLPAAEPARLYFARRGLSLKYVLATPNLRFHRSLPYFHEGELIGEFPAIIALVYDGELKPVTIHRTFIDEEGYKAKVPYAKKLMPYPSDRNLKGACIPLMELNVGNCVEGSTALGVTEGIETAFSIIEAADGRLPVWPLISDKILEGFIPPHPVSELCIYGDQDVEEAGLMATVKLKSRLTEDFDDVQVVGYLPPRCLIEHGEKGVDWLDVYIRYGKTSIPMPKSLKHNGETDE